MFRCFAHVTSLGVTDTMGAVTKVSAIETTQAIWEYDPQDPTNR